MSSNSTSPFEQASQIARDAGRTAGGIAVGPGPRPCRAGTAVGRMPFAPRLPGVAHFRGITGSRRCDGYSALW